MIVYENEEIEVTTQAPTSTSTSSTEYTSLLEYNDSIDNWYDSAPITSTDNDTVNALNSIASELHMIRILIVLFALVFIVWRAVNVVKRGLNKLADF